MNVKVGTKNKGLILTIPYSELNVIKARSIPERRFDKSTKTWRCKPSLANMEYIRATWPDANWSSEAGQLWDGAQKRLKQREAVITAKHGEIDLSSLDGFPFKTAPMTHQKRCLALMKDLASFAVFMDQGTGKTKTVLDDIAYNFTQDRIDAAIILAPNSVKTNWVDFFEPDAVDQHLPNVGNVLKGVWLSDGDAKWRKAWKEFEAALPAAAGHRRLVIVAVNYEALLMGRVFDFLENFVKAFRTAIVADESTRIKKPKAKRTKLAKKLREECPVARIMTGTPVVKRPLDAYSQLEFLDPDILGHGSFYAFRNHIAVLGGFEGKQVLFYKKEAVEELKFKMSSNSYRVTKEECLDLPPKIMQKRFIDMTKEQAKLYQDMREKCLAECAGHVVGAPIVLTQMLRLQQITSGFWPIIKDGETIGYEPIMPPEKNPKLAETLGIIDEAGDRKFVIWSRFDAEIDAILALLAKQGLNVVPYHGRIKSSERLKNKIAFQQDESINGLVGNQAAGGIGLDFYKGQTIVYLSNTPDTEQRVQSEDRTHRIGTTAPPTYYDLLVRGTVDMRIMSIIRGDLKLSHQIMGDQLAQWI